MRAASLLLLVALAACVAGSSALSFRVQGFQHGEVRKLPTAEGTASAGVVFSIVADSPMPANDWAEASVYCTVRSQGIRAMNLGVISWYSGMRISTSAEMNRFTLDREGVEYASCHFEWTKLASDATWAAAALPADIDIEFDRGIVGRPAGTVTPVVGNGGGPDGAVAVGGTYTYRLTSSMAAGTGGAQYDVQCYYMVNQVNATQSDVYKQVLSVTPAVFAEGSTRASYDITFPATPRVLSWFHCLYILRTDLAHDPLFEKAVVDFELSAQVALKPTMALNGLGVTRAQAGGGWEANIITPSTKTRRVSVTLSEAPTAPVSVRVNCAFLANTVFNVSAGVSTSQEIVVPTPTGSVDQSCTFTVVTSLAGRDTAFDTLQWYMVQVKTRQAPFMYRDGVAPQGISFGAAEYPTRIEASVTSVTMQVRADVAPGAGPVRTVMTCQKSGSSAASDRFQVQFTIAMGETSTTASFAIPHDASIDLTYQCAFAMDPTLSGRDEDWDTANIPPQMAFVGLSSSGSNPSTGGGSSTPRDGVTTVVFLINQTKAYLSSVESLLYDGLAAALNIANSRFSLLLEESDKKPGYTAVLVAFTGRDDGDSASLTSASLGAELKRQVSSNSSSLYAQPIYADSQMEWVDLGNSAGVSGVSVIATFFAALLALIAGAAL